ncbi:proton-conducting transporter membrane subunit [Bizionia sediminis]|uniref:Proton-conducting transporter membrane subunit n=1 Tax=Bizionia sediminis TaxID=1737064 RepID=A0ABW5KU01_9FLAO
MTTTKKLETQKTLADATLPPLRPAHRLSKIFIPLAWILFLANVAYVVLYAPNLPEVTWGSVIALNGLSSIMWLVVTFFSAVIQTYAANYLKGFKYKGRFLVISFFFTLSVMLFVASNHVVLFCVSWFIMGFLMTQLIGINSAWKEGQHAARYALNNYIGSTLFLGAAVGLLTYTTGIWTISGIREVLPQIEGTVTVVAALGVLMAALIQSAIFPFHKWLMSAMTSPTPASALMHAGFVNAAGILLTIFAPLLVQAEVLTITFIIGCLTAIFSQYSKLLQVNVKQKLACSTSAQMSFMIMQCGLGFFSAAITHLILHGFYKAYLFLASGEEIKNGTPQPPQTVQLKPLETLFILGISILGGVMFALLTGKGLVLDTGLFLTFIVAITVGQVSYNVLNHGALPMAKKLIILPLASAVGIAVYALTYNGVAALLKDMPMANMALEFTFVHALFGVIFLVAFYIMLTGMYRKIPWLYVKLLNASQPYEKTILSTKSNRS